MRKRGQITTFIILGIVVLAVVAFFIYMTGVTTKASLERAVPPDVVPIQTFVDQCVAKTAEYAVVDVSAQGGDYLPDKYIRVGFYDVPYYLYPDPSQQNNITLYRTSIDYVQSSLSTYMNRRLSDCVGNLSSFQNEGYSFEFGNVSATALILPSKVLFTVDYPIGIAKDNSKSSMQKFSAEVNVPLALMINASNEYLDKQSEALFSFRSGSLLDISYQNGIKSYAGYFGSGNVVVDQVDENTIINGQPYVYSFALKYAWI